MRRDVEPLSERDEGLVNAALGEVAQHAAPGSPLRHTRRLSDKVLVAFHHACDNSDLEVAEQLLNVLGIMLARRPTSTYRNNRRSIEGLVAAHERIWHLRHPMVN